MHNYSYARDHVFQKTIYNSFATYNDFLYSLRIKFH